PELVTALARAAARVLGADRPFVVGRDTRRSGPLLEAALVAGFCIEGAGGERGGGFSRAGARAPPPTTLPPTAACSSSPAAGPRLPARPSSESSSSCGASSTPAPAPA